MAVRAFDDQHVPPRNGRRVRALRAGTRWNLDPAVVDPSGEQSAAGIGVAHALVDALAPCRLPSRRRCRTDLRPIHVTFRDEALAQGVDWLLLPVGAGELPERPAVGLRYAPRRRRVPGRESGHTPSR